MASFVTPEKRPFTPLKIFAFIAVLVCLVVGYASAQVEPPSQTIEPAIADSNVTMPAPVTSLVVEDVEYDNAEALKLSWVPSIDDQLIDSRVVGYKVYRIANEGAPEEIATLIPGANHYTDTKVESDNTYVYCVSVLSLEVEVPCVHSAPATPQREWLNFDRKWLFLIALIISGAVIYFVESAKRGRKLFVRRIAGLEAIDDAVGRATEMGRPVLFIPGINDMDDVQTLAALTILGRVSRTIADYDSKIFMPVARSLVMTSAREIIKGSYQTAGRVDAYNDDMVNYITDEQFGYVAAVDGIMVRERPATVFLLGAFFAESLILAETGNSVGAIQIAGTARPAQLPFFIAACDFTLIGEELFAASAYLSGEPRQLGSLKGQDIGKGIAMAVIVLGVLTVTLAEAYGIEVTQDFFDFLSSVFSSR